MNQPRTEHDELSELRAKNELLEQAHRVNLKYIEQQTLFNRELWEDLDKVRRATLWQHVVLWWRSA